MGAKKQTGKIAKQQSHPGTILGEKAKQKSHLANGMYMLNVRSESVNEVFHMVIEK